MNNANTDNLRPRLADAIYDIAAEYSAEILTDNRFWHILSHKFSFASDPALRNAMHYCIDEELIAMCIITATILK